MRELTPELLAEITRAEIGDAYHYFDAILLTLDVYEINTINRVAGFLATISVESARLTKFEEGLYYKDPVRLAGIFRRVFDLNKDKKISPEEVENAKKFCKNPKALSMILYNGYHGRGPIQITWEKNYRAYSEDSGRDVIANPDLLLEPEIGFDSAGWFWYINGCNEAADRDSMFEMTTIVNGPARMHLAERTELYRHGKAILQN